MPESVTLFGMAVLMLGLTALGLSAVFQASRLSAAGGRQLLVRRRIQAREGEALDLRKRLDGVEAEARGRQATLDGLLAERSRVLAATNALTLSKIEMVHEVGEPQPGAVLFQGELRLGDAPSPSGRGEPRRIVFAREIWERGNIVHVWAETPEAATAAVQRAFNARSGIVASRMQRGAPSRLDARPDGRPDGRLDGRTDGRTDGRPDEGARAGRDPARPALRMASVAPRVA